MIKKKSDIKVEQLKKVKFNDSQDLKPKILVLGTGGAGGNAVNNMISSDLKGVEFIVCNTDAQAMENALTEKRVQIGFNITEGLGAGASPEVGKASAEESMSEILDYLKDAHMVFITAGMGGGTGTGAAPVIAKAVKELGILTVGVVTKPFHFEGIQRMKTAEIGIKELQESVDTLIVIPNQNLFRISNAQTTFSEAFKLADDVLYAGVRGVTDLMMMPGLINLDFADIRSVMSEMGKAMMGTGEAEGENRAILAAESAISNPLLDDSDMKTAQGILISIVGGQDMTLFEVDEAANRIREEVQPDANIIFGATFDEKLKGKFRVSVVATGIGNQLQVNNAKILNSNKNQDFNQDKFLDLKTSCIEEEKITEEGIDANVEQALPLNEVSQEQNQVKQINFFQRLFKKNKTVAVDEIENTKLSSVERDLNFEKNNINSNTNVKETEELDIPAYIRRKK